MPTSVNELQARAEQAGQGQLFENWASLNDAERAQLTAQLETIDFTLLKRLTDELKAGGVAKAKSVPQLEPAPVVKLPQTVAERSDEAQARMAGEAALRAGRVGYFLVAGGQGTRLGLNGPKGIFQIGPVTKRSLFQIHAEKIRALRHLYSAAMPWVIMTSDANDAATRAYFTENDFFGLGQNTVYFCVQENMPALSRDGKILRAGKASLALSPNGHGGSIKALYDSGATKWLRGQGVDTLSYFQVDNALVKIGDPIFIGRHLIAKAEMSSKVVRKRDWKEKVGVVGYVDGKLGVIEYSDLPDAIAQETLPDGSLRWWAGSIAIHMLDLGFIERLNTTENGFQLPFHRADKSVPCVNADGSPVPLKPGEKNGIKLETFIFDALPLTKASVTLETARELDFAPVKNAEGEDSPATCRAMLTEVYARWLEAYGHKVPRLNGVPDCKIEISPLSSLDGEGLRDRQIPEIRRGGILIV